MKIPPILPFPSQCNAPITPLTCSWDVSLSQRLFSYTATWNFCWLVMQGGHHQCCHLIHWVQCPLQTSVLLCLSFVLKPRNLGCQTFESTRWCTMVVTGEARGEFHNHRYFLPSALPSNPCSVPTCSLPWGLLALLWNHWNLQQFLYVGISLLVQCKLAMTDGSGKFLLSALPFSVKIPLILIQKIWNQFCNQKF